MFYVGDVIDGKYIVDGLCSNAGGMGTVLFVTPRNSAPKFQVVLKYCKDTADEQLQRFRREVRLLASFKGNSKVVMIADHNLDCDPPYFVMKHYADGDLLKQAPAISQSLEAQEKSILQMIDCIQELHSRNEFHRDIKPQNFLLDGDQIVVSDFGLTTEIGSETGFTRSSVYWGTHGYIPPEFLTGGFKHADAAGDIFMLGKTIYVLLSQRDPTYLLGDGLPPPIFHIIERCCSIPKAQRYQSLAELRQSIVAAFDILLGRVGGVGKVKQLLSAINDRLEQSNKYTTQEVSEFVEQLALLDEQEQIKICFELTAEFFAVIRQGPVIASLRVFLAVYEKLVESQGYSWSFAETIAKNMKTIFSGDDVPLPQKSLALDLAIRASIYMNRFAAMGTCREMITSINDETLGLQVVGLITKYQDTFVGGIEPSECNSDSIANALHAFRAK
ncbi:MAG: protein kinase [Azonexus sp.]|nr:protein kinase [Azonexus sp.]